MLRILNKKGQPKLLLFSCHAYVAVALVTADHPTVLTDETLVSSSQITIVLSVICASLHFVPSTNVIAIGYAFVLVIVVSRMMSALKSGSRSPEPDGTDSQAGLKKSFGRRCCLACEVNG